MRYKLKEGDYINYHPKPVPALCPVTGVPLMPSYTPSPVFGHILEYNPNHENPSERVKIEIIETQVSVIGHFYDLNHIVHCSAEEVVPEKGSKEVDTKQDIYLLPEDLVSKELTNLMGDYLILPTYKVRDVVATRSGQIGTITSIKVQDEGFKYYLRFSNGYTKECSYGDLRAIKKGQ